MKKIVELVGFVIQKLRRNLLYSAVWIIALGTIIFINSFTKKSYTFVGVTTSKEMNINLEHPVIIKSVSILSGEAIKKGQLLLELERPDLNTKISDAQRRLEELMAQYKLNSRLNSNLKSLKKYKVSKFVKEDEDLLGIQIKSVEKELKSFLQEQEELYIFSKFDGYIGSVNYKKGESVSPFQPIVTVYQKTPSSIQGFIHENISNNVLERKSVLVTSANGTKKIQGQIFSLGTRIIEFPERFRRSATEKIWGREVGIQLPKDNNFLLGEKVFIEIDPKSKSLDDSPQRSIADETDDIEDGYQRIEASEDIVSQNLIEPSGLAYIKELGKFMMISDDNMNDDPLIYLLNKDGVLDSHVLKVDGLKSIKDIESITTDEKGNIFLISSQSPNRKGKVSKDRRRVVKIKREGVRLTMESKFSLFSQLNRLAKGAKHLAWVRLLAPKVSNSNSSKYSIELDIEGSFIKNGDLFLGLRRPLGREKRVVVLKIANVEKSLNSEKISLDQVSIWRTLTLPITRRQDRNEGISGMHIEGDQLFILTANNGQVNAGRLFVSRFSNTSQVKEVKRFDTHRPEGLSYDAEEKKLYVVFDSNKPNTPLVMSVVDMGDK